MILMYHNVDEKAGFNTVSADNFERQLRFVQQHWQITDMDTYVRECHTNPHLATVTFDDAYYGIINHVLPIIKELDIPITVFVPVAFIGEYNKWDQHLSDYMEIKILPWEDIERLSQLSCITLGSHGMNHISLGTLSRNQIETEIKGSKRILEEHFQKPVDYFAFPFGQRKDLGYATPELLQEVGYKAAFTTLWKRNNIHENLYRLRRVEVRPQDTPEQLLQTLTAPLDFRFLKQEVKSLLR